MPIPFVAAAGAVIGPALLQAGRWLLFAEAGKAVVKVLGFLGLSLATNELAIEPIMDNVAGWFGAIPGDLTVWLGALGIDKVASILISAYLVSGISRVFLRKASGN